MPEARTIACPHCGAERTTTAGAGQRVRCRSCGELYLTPRGSIAPTLAPAATSEPTPAATDAAVSAVPSPGTAAVPAPSSSAVTVAEAVTIKPAAKPRAAKSDAGPGSQPAAGDAPSQEQVATPAAEPTPVIPAAVSGRRGGLGSAMRRRVTGRG